MNSAQNASVREDSAFMKASGLVIETLEKTRATGYADLGEDQLMPKGVVHGGVYATIVETIGSAGASHAVSELGQYSVGVNNSTDFLRPSTGTHATVVAEALYQGRTQQLWQVVITDSATGKDLARGQLRVQNVPESPEQ
ncbi:hypothetical protein GCM10023190_18510 [Enteractinococcus fodinae]|uniref:Uncharacterized protein (TIGR00369 family) n=1 Tax=Enteractinococcus fodinae TaxID=684663 RepID=A0ABU2B554_9MICC|nr:PaaI family thioesterase [Enteractinococcus fodinae]MDR7348391.1 uncharacterized protein (TIGR00369 family) [Enteractinococcus fodinae]